MARIDYMIGGLYYLSLLFPVLGGLFFIKKMPRPAMIFFFLTAIAFMTETVALMMALRKVSNYPVYQIYLFIETTLIASVLYLWNEKPFIRTLIAVFYGLMAISWIYFGVIMRSKQGFANMPLIIESIIFMLAASHFMANLLNEGKNSVFGDHRFWLCLGMLLNYSGNIFIYSSLNFVLTQAVTLWRIHWIVNAAANGIYAVGFICLKWTNRQAQPPAVSVNETVWDTVH